jgi:hypothetical protein
MLRPSAGRDADGDGAAVCAAIKCGRDARVCAADGGTAAVCAVCECGRGARVCAADCGRAAVCAVCECGRDARVCAADGPKVCPQGHVMVLLSPRVTYQCIAVTGLLILTRMNCFLALCTLS